MGDSVYSLDPLSTSQKEMCCIEYPTREESAFTKCVYGAPFFAVEVQPHQWRVMQGSCNHWDCPRCGEIRAKHEYGRIVNGATVLSTDHDLYFITITTRGAELSLADAQENYLLWTNRFTSRLRANAAKRGEYWCYVQVTERQKRAHPHSHILTTYHPADLIEGVKEQWEKLHGVRQMYYADALRSDYLQAAVCDAGLGEQYDVSKVNSAAAVSRYIAKYLFKSSLHTVWPEKWKRVRYSQNWPKLPAEHDRRAIVLLKRDDWYNLATMAEIVRTPAESLEIVSNKLWAYPVAVKEWKR